VESLHAGHEPAPVGMLFLSGSILHAIEVGIRIIGKGAIYIKNTCEKPRRGEVNSFPLLIFASSQRVEKSP
jgi:hypothetical protein